MGRLRPRGEGRRARSMVRPACLCLRAPFEPRPVAIADWLAPGSRRQPLSTRQENVRWPTGVPAVKSASSALPVD